MTVNKAITEAVSVLCLVASDEEIELTLRKKALGAFKNLAAFQPAKHP